MSPLKGSHYGDLLKRTTTQDQKLIEKLAEEGGIEAVQDCWLGLVVEFFGK